MPGRCGRVVVVTTFTVRRDLNCALACQVGVSDGTWDGDAVVITDVANSLSFDGSSSPTKTVCACGVGHSLPAILVSQRLTGDPGLADRHGASRPGDWCVQRHVLVVRLRTDVAGRVQVHTHEPQSSCRRRHADAGGAFLPPPSRLLAPFLAAAAVHEQ